MIRAGAAILLCTLVAGCGLLPVGGDGDLDPSTTGSITVPKPATPAAPPKRSIVDSLDPGDWEAIRNLASTGMATSAEGSKLDWTNADTGSNGTLTPTAASMAKADGRSCRPFALTVSDIRGIRGYRGNACRAPDGAWQLFDVTPDDRALL